MVMGEILTSKKTLSSHVKRKNVILRLKLNLTGNCKR